MSSSDADYYYGRVVTVMSPRSTGKEIYTQYLTLPSSARGSTKSPSRGGVEREVEGGEGGREGEGGRGREREWGLIGRARAL
jgi:hypothetical protein